MILNSLASQGVVRQDVCLAHEPRSGHPDYARVEGYITARARSSISSNFRPFG